MRRGISGRGGRWRLLIGVEEVGDFAGYLLQRIEFQSGGSSGRVYYYISVLFEALHSDAVTL